MGAPFVVGACGGSGHVFRGCVGISMPRVRMRGDNKGMNWCFDSVCACVWLS